MTTANFSPEAEAAVVLSCLRLGADSLAARKLKQLVGEETPCLPPDPIRLAEHMGVPESHRGDLVATARRRAAGALERAARADLAVLPYFDEAYPAWLRTIIDPPIVLWTRGDPSLLSQPIVAIVGSRRATPVALVAARRLAVEISQAGLIVASGMARGVDAAAHEGALEAGAPTIAVLGCGADVVYPPEHGTLAARIRETGVIVSELPPGLPPLQHHFPLRNRIISGLSKGVVVVEAGERSGSLITARQAIEQSRDVMAVPGAIVSGRYRGSHALIKDGARLVETVGDVLEQIGWKPGPTAGLGLGSNPSSLSELEAAMTTGDVYTVDDLARRIQRPATTLLAELGALELAGRIVRQPGGGFVRT